MVLGFKCYVLGLSWSSADFMNLTRTFDMLDEMGIAEIVDSELEIIHL